MRQVWHGNVEFIVALGQVESNWAVIKDWFFKVVHAPLAGATAKKVLRALIHEIPSQV
jgi:hypothetical protein